MLEEDPKRKMKCEKEIEDLRAKIGEKEREVGAV